jgi:putative intracellular protease/amidase
MHILIVTTSASMLPPNHPTGLWLEEFAVPYDHFIAHGAHVTVASPLGGAVPLDPRTEPDDRDRIRYFGALRALQSSHTLAGIDDSFFDGLFIPGGHGPVVDLVHDRDLHRLIAGFEEDGKFIGAVCHGPAALLEVRGSDGHYLVRDRRLTGFSNLEERLAGMHAKVPFLLEDELKKRGARYDSALLPMTSHVIRDGNLITGQNPASSAGVAHEFLEGLQRNIELFDALGLRDGFAEITEHSATRAADPRGTQPTVWPGY